jgi:NTE family protein
MHNGFISGETTAMKQAKLVLVLQGGGALGSYQAGAFEEMEKHGLVVDWVVGTSIGAINGAIIAGNRPEHRVKQLKAFWATVSEEKASPLPGFDGFSWLKPWAQPSRTYATLTQGIPGFFKPLSINPWTMLSSPPTGHTSFYDTAPLAETLHKHVDFDYLNTAAVKLSVSAVNVATGELTRFDNFGGQKISADHIMASGALPPGFPPVEIAGQKYWDGGIYSNTPIDYVLDDAERQDTLCFMIDLWDPTEAIPTSIQGVIARQKNIQYASRSHEHLDDHRKMQNLRRTIRLLAEQVPPAKRNSRKVRALIEQGCTSSINIVRLIMKALPEDDHLKDIDFSVATLNKRWAAGQHDVGRVFKHKQWLKPLAPEVGMAIHELLQDESP